MIGVVARGRRGVEMAWWHANNFPQHRFANVFDDVIGNVRASGGIKDLADDCMRGAVDVQFFIFRRFGVFNIYNKLLLQVLAESNGSMDARESAPRMKAPSSPQFIRQMGCPVPPPLFYFILMVGVQVLQSICTVAFE